MKSWRSTEVSLDGAKVVYNPLLHGSVIRNGIVDYEPAIADAVRVAAAPGKVFYDIGANIGIFAVIAEQAGAEVFAFEPEENNLLYLRKNVRHAIDFAIGATDGEAAFDRRGGAFSGRLSARPIGRSRIVAVRSVDSLVATGWPPPDLIKIDVEGSEGEVLMRARSTLRTHKPVVICEVHGAENSSRAREILHSVGYRLEWLDASHLRATPERDSGTG